MKPAPTYTAVLQRPLDRISWEDENFMDELFAVAQLFRPFSVAMTEFLSQHGYAGEKDDTPARVSFIRKAFASAHMEAPREIREWFAAEQPIKRDTAFQLCFAFGLDGNETDEFFRRIYARERSFNCHQVQEAVYYFCLNNGLSWADALDVQSRVRLAKKEPARGEVVYTGSIVAELNALETKEELIDWLNHNMEKFSGNNVTAFETIRRLWNMAAGPDGLLIEEQRRLPSLLDDYATGETSALRAGEEGARPWDAYLAIFQLNRKEVKKLGTDRSIRPILESLHQDVQDSFPDREGIGMILRGEHVSYERVRKWLVLLTFYTFWAQKAVEKGDYEAAPGDAERGIARMNKYLVDSGYPELYVGNPFDWVFFYAAKREEPLFVFRFIWNELLTLALEKRR